MPRKAKQVPPRECDPFVFVAKRSGEDVLYHAFHRVVLPNAIDGEIVLCSEPLTSEAQIKTVLEITRVYGMGFFEEQKPEVPNAKG